jgi:hypothetical protein
MMQEKEISSEDVENCIDKGSVEKQGAYIYCYTFKNNQPLWVMLDNSGRVLLIGD